MSQDKVFDFKITMPFEKSARDDGRWIISGLAAGTEVDMEGDVIDPAAIVGLAEQINSSYIPFKDWHNKNTVLSDVGQCIKADVAPNHDLHIDVELDQDHPTAQYIWKKLDQGKQFGFSVFGKTVNPRPDIRDGRMVRRHMNILLDEVSSTTKPIYTPSLGTVLKKAVDESPQGEVMEDETKTPQTQETPEASAPENATVPETTEVEKAVTAESKRDLQKIKKLVKLQRETAELLRELGLDVEDESEQETVETAKSETSEVDIASLVKSNITEAVAPLLAEIAALKSSIPAQSAPGVLVKSGEATREEILEAVHADPRLALRMGLAGLTGETFRG